MVVDDGVLPVTKVISIGASFSDHAEEVGHVIELLSNTHS